MFYANMKKPDRNPGDEGASMELPLWESLHEVVRLKAPAGRDRRAPWC